MQRLLQTGEYQVGIKRKSDSVLDGVECWPSAEKGDTAKQYFMRMKELGVKRPRIDKPCNTFLNRWGLLLPVSPEQAYDPEQVQFKHYEVRVKRHEQLRTKQFHLFLYPNEAAVRFRLDLPLTDQLEMAKVQLAELVAKYSGQLKSDAPSPWEDVGKKQVTDSALKNAHYWLRCYDAKREPKTLAGDPNRKRAQKSGPKVQVTRFNEEKKSAGRGDFIVTTALKSYVEQATDFIEKGKYLLLLLPVSDNQQ